MKTVLIVLCIAVAVVALMMAGLGVKMLFRREKEFRRPCSSSEPVGRCGRKHPESGRCANCTCGMTMTDREEREVKN